MSPNSQYTPWVGLSTLLDAILTNGRQYEISCLQQQLNKQMGKQRMKYRLTMKLHKLIFSDVGLLRQGWQFKVKVERGKYKRQFTTLPLRKGEIKCSKETQIIPMTLFYDVDDRVFLEKTMEISAELVDQFDSTKREFGEAKLNVIDYMKDKPEYVNLQVKLYDEKQQYAIIVFHVLVEKEDDDNRSVKTNQTYQSSENGDSVKGMKKENKANQPPKPCELSPSENVSQKSVNTSSKPPKYPKKEESVRSPSYSSRNMTEKDQEPSREQHSQRGNPKRSETSKSKRDKSKQTKKENLQENNTERSGLQLQLFLSQKQVRKKEEMLEAAKRTIDAQNQIIATLQRQQDKAFKSTEVLKQATEIESLKSQLLRANLKISQLETVNRTLENNERENMKIIDLKTKQAAYYKQQLQQIKLKIGNLMQRCFEAQQFDFMAVIEEQLEKDE